MATGFFQRFSDGLANIVSGLGTSNDRRTYARYIFAPLDYMQIAAAYRSSWMVRKGVNLPPYDMTRAGRDWQADKATIAKLEAEEERLSLWAKLKLGLVYGRLGGGAIIFGIGDENPALPVNPRSLALGSIRHATTWTRWQITIGPKITDPASQFFGGPEYYTLNTAGQPVRIHPSRVIAFTGAPVVPGVGTSWEDEFWGDSCLQAVEDAVKNADSAQNGFASLISEAKIDVYKIPGLTALAATAEFEKALTQRMRTSNLFKSQYNALLLDAGNGTQGSGEEWDQRQVTWAGIPAIVMMYVSLVAGSFDIPATRFIGKSPDGMNATGEGDENAYYAMIAALQTSDLKPLLARIDALLIPSALGKMDESVWWKFAPLRELTEKEEAENFDKTMDAVTKLQNTSTIPDEAMSKGIQNLMAERSWIPGLDDALADIPEDERFPSPDDLMEGGDPDLGGAGGDGSATRPAPRAVNDARFTDGATPKSLYVSRKLLNAEEVIRWAKSQGLETTVPAADMHVTVALSRAPVDWFGVGTDWAGDEQSRIRVKPGGARDVERLGDGSAVVLLFTSDDLEWRHKRIIEAGASWDWPEYRPHVTLSWNAPGVDVSKIEPYAGLLVFGPELFAEVKEDWKAGVTEE